MKSLLLMRHAKSSWKDESLDDHDRPLNKRGKKEAPRMGELLREEDLLPDYVVASSARRARKTAEHVAFAAGYRGETRITSELYAAPADRILAVTRQTPDPYSRLLLLGHNPGLEEFLELLTGKCIQLSTATIAVLECDIDSWTDLGDENSTHLIDVWQPRGLGKN